MKLTRNICVILVGLLMVLELSSGAMVRRKRAPRYRRSDSSSSSEDAATGGPDASASGPGDAGGAGGDKSGGGIMDKTKGMVGKVPFIGSSLSGGIQKGMDAWHKGQDLTNGGIGRVLGGAFPCTLDIDSFRCTGVSTNSDMSELLGTILGPIPMLPGPLADLIVFLMDLAWAPTLDLLFGGVKQ